MPTTALVILVFLFLVFLVMGTIDVVLSEKAKREDFDDHCDDALDLNK